MTEISFGRDGWSKMDSYKNNIADNNAAGRPQAPIMARTATQELTDDFSLPDYKPEIRRLISVTASVSPAAHYLTTGHAIEQGGDS